MARKIKYKLYIDRDDTQTVATRNSETGRLTGRRVIRKRERGDKTFPRRVSSPKKYAGEIMGRSQAIQVRGDSEKRGTIRRRL